MATDRMYLDCPSGARIGLARYLAPPWQAYDGLTERLNQWFMEHQDHEEGRWPARPTLVFGSDLTAREDGVEIGVEHT